MQQAPMPVEPAPPAAPAPAADGGAQPDKKIVNNPFTPGGVTTVEQTITRKEVVRLIAEMETRLRKEMGGDINSDEINKLIMNAAGGSAKGPTNLIGCVNGVPLYRDDEGALTLGTKEPEEVKKQRCGS
ncbi:MAG TPA: hypothetical protein PKW15_06435 [Alphaproteobacteria bacterium]|nr:hypothetical protein [Alphaproteobacteria bacterium]